MKPTPPKDTYFVAVKIFLEDDLERFLITKDRFGDWDIPGGRLRTNDFRAPLETVVKRKLTEELGPTVRYRLLGSPEIFFRHERNEILESGKREKRRIFALGYRAKFLGGTPKTGKNHVKSVWFDPRTMKIEDYLTGGWLRGAKEYIRLRKKIKVARSATQALSTPAPLPKIKISRKI